MDIPIESPWFQLHFFTLTHSLLTIYYQPLRIYHILRHTILRHTIKNIPFLQLRHTHSSTIKCIFPPWPIFRRHNSQAALEEERQLSGQEREVGWPAHPSPHGAKASWHPEKLLDDFHGKSIYKWFSSWKILFFSHGWFGASFHLLIFFMK